MIKAAPFEEALPLPTTQAEVPIFDPMVVSPFVLTETLAEMEEAEFADRKIGDGGLDLVFIRGNFLVYTSDGHPVAGSFFNPFAVVDGVDPWAIHPKMAQIGTRMERLVEVRSCFLFPFLPGSAAGD